MSCITYPTAWLSLAQCGHLVSDFLILNYISEMGSSGRYFMFHAGSPGLTLMDIGLPKKRDSKKKKKGSKRPEDANLCNLFNQK
jgi:hypothetical protein